VETFIVVLLALTKASLSKLEHKLLYQKPKDTATEIPKRNNSDTVRKIKRV
jgi:hypothetical protein